MACSVTRLPLSKVPEMQIVKVWCKLSIRSNLKAARLQVWDGGPKPEAYLSSSHLCSFQDEGKII